LRLGLNAANVAGLWVAGIAVANGARNLGLSRVLKGEHDEKRFV
jgi:hypothetical protein